MQTTRKYALMGNIQTICNLCGNEEKDCRQDVRFIDEPRGHETKSCKYASRSGKRWWYESLDKVKFL